MRVTPDTTICAGMPVRLNASITYDTIRTTAIARCDSYTEASIPYTTLTTTGTNITLGDDQVSGALPIGFNFNFFVIIIVNIYIKALMVLTFNGTSGSGCCSGSIIPSADGIK